MTAQKQPRAYHERRVPFTAGDGRPLDVINVRGTSEPTRSPVLLVHGAGVRASIFRAPVRQNIVDALIEHGYDVWLENWRASIDFEPNPWTLDQAALFQRIDDAYHGRAIEPHRLGECPLGDPGIRFDQEHDARAPGRHLADARGEVAKHRLLRQAQPVAEELREDAVPQLCARALCVSGWQAIRRHRTRNRIAGFRGT